MEPVSRLPKIDWIALGSELNLEIKKQTNKKSPGDKQTSLGATVLT